MRNCIISVVIFLTLVGIPISIKNAVASVLEASNRILDVRYVWDRVGSDAKVRYTIPKEITVTINHNYGNWIEFTAKGYGLTYHGFLYIGEPNDKLD